MSHSPKILVVEDELEIRRFLKALLIQNKYEVYEAANAEEGLRRITNNPPELVILDLGLPDKNGNDIIRAVREWSQIPIIVLSAHDREEDKVQALELGADDYLSKPFGAGELLARIKVALRHALRNNDKLYDFSGLQVDLAKRLVLRDGKEVHLTPIEYKLLAVLVKHAGKVVTHKQLLAEVWGKSAGANGSYLRIHTQHLREKLGDDSTKPKYIITEAGVGYRLKD